MKVNFLNSHALLFFSIYNYANNSKSQHRKCTFLHIKIKSRSNNFIDDVVCRIKLFTWVSADKIKILTPPNKKLTDKC